MVRELAKEYTLVRSFVLGAAAYLSGYLVTLAWLGNRITPIADDVTADITYNSAETTIATEPSLSSIIEQFGGISSNMWAGWLFSNAHFVPLSLGISGKGTSASIPNILFEAEESSLLILFLIPPITLILSGWVSGRLSRPTIRGVLPAGVNHGMLVVTGYLPLTIAGALIFSISRPWEYSGVSPDLLMSVVVMGLIYPLVFGGIGGWLSTKFTSPQEPGSAYQTQQSS